MALDLCFQITKINHLYSNQFMLQFFLLLFKQLQDHLFETMFGLFSAQRFLLFFGLKMFSFLLINLDSDYRFQKFVLIFCFGSVLDFLKVF